MVGFIQSSQPPHAKNVGMAHAAQVPTSAPTPTKRFLSEVGPILHNQSGNIHKLAKLTFCRKPIRIPKVIALATTSNINPFDRLRMQNIPKRAVRPASPALLPPAMLSSHSAGVISRNNPSKPGLADPPVEIIHFPKPYAASPAKKLNTAPAISGT